jgi:hypothetical protein
MPLLLCLYLRGGDPKCNETTRMDHVPAAAPSGRAVALDLLTQPVFRARATEQQENGIGMVGVTSQTYQCYWRW